MSDINTYTDRSFAVSLGRAPAVIKELTMSDGKSKGLLVPCPCGGAILVHPKDYVISHAGGKISITPDMIHRHGGGCGKIIRVVGSQIQVLNVSKESEDAAETAFGDDGSSISGEPGDITE